MNIYTKVSTGDFGSSSVPKNPKSLKPPIVAQPSAPLRRRWSSSRRVRPKRSNPTLRCRETRPKRQNPMQICCRMHPKRPNLTSFFIVFRGCVGRAIPLAARRGEPSFSLAGAALSRVRRLCRRIAIRPKSMKKYSDDASQPSSAKGHRFLHSRMPLGVAFGRPGALPDAPGRSFWRPGVPLGTLRTIPGHAGDVPRRSRSAFAASPERSGEPWDVRDRL